MKKILSIFISLVLLLSVVAVFAPALTVEAEEVEGPEKFEEGEDTGMGAVPLDEIKVGFVHITDPSDQGYTYNHNRGTEGMMEELGLREDQILNKFNTPETAEAATAIRDLAESGCHIIFATSFGFEEYMLEVAADYPDIEFCHATGFRASSSELKNVHNYFGAIYQARYLSGIVAGLKTETNVLGYVTAMPFAECISGFTGFYLGAKSVNPDVTMLVQYTNSWHDPTAEAQVAQSLIDLGADVIGQHCDSTAPATAAEAAGVWHIGYNSDMREAAPDASMTSAIWDWSQYLIYAVNQRSAGAAIAVDWSKGLAEHVVLLSEYNEDLMPEGAEEAVQEAYDRIVSGDWDVFTGPLVDIDGNVVVEEGDTFIEPQSAPSWGYILEGITIVGE